MTNQDFVKYHLYETLLGGVAEADGNDALSRRLHAQARLRLISMSDEELCQLAKLTASPPERSVELTYQGYKREIKKIRATASEWLTDLQTRRPLPEKESAPKRVIIIEPDPILSQRLAATLSEAGFSIVLVSFSLDIMPKMDEIDPDMIIVDETLPSIDGMEVCSRLRNIFGVPVILLGRDSSGRQWARAVEAGADLYLRIPFSNRVLVARVNAILRRYKEG